MRSLTPVDRQSLISAIASREGTAKQLAERYRVSVDELRSFVEDNREAIERASDALQTTQASTATITPTQLDDLWIANKFERLKRLQECADELYADAMHGGLSGADLATAVREFRSYLMLAANELGQLLHRGSGDGGAGDTLSVEVAGVDMDSLR